MNRSHSIAKPPAVERQAIAQAIASLLPGGFQMVVRDVGQAGGAPRGHLILSEKIVADRFKSF